MTSMNDFNAQITDEFRANAGNLGGPSGQYLNTASNDSSALLRTRGAHWRNAFPSTSLPRRVDPPTRGGSNHWSEHCARVHLPRPHLLDVLRRDSD